MLNIYFIFFFVGKLYIFCQWFSNTMHYIASKLDKHNDERSLEFLHILGENLSFIMLYLCILNKEPIWVYKKFFLLKCITLLKFSCSVTILKISIQKVSRNVILNILLPINYWINYNIATHGYTWKWKWKRYLLSCVQPFGTPWTLALQAPLFIQFSRQEYWSGLPFPSPGDLPNPGIEPGSPTLQADSLPSEPPGKPINYNIHHRWLSLTVRFFYSKIEPISNNVPQTIHIFD